MAGDEDGANPEADASTDGIGGVRRRRAPVRPRDGDVGNTLRTVYQQTVNEDVPSEMLDLLGKLA